MYKIIVVFLLSVCIGVSFSQNAYHLEARKESVITWKGHEPDLPVSLYNLPESGKTAIKWYKELDAGLYRLSFLSDIGKKRRDVLFLVDGKALAYHSAYFTSEQKEKAPVYNFDFVIEDSGTHVIELRRRPGIHIPQGDELVIKLLTVERLANRSFDYHWNGDLPGRSYCHLWGWEGNSNYQRRNDRKITRNYWDKRLVEEPAKWGSNYIQLYPYAHNNYLQGGNFRDAIEYAHEWGYLLDQHASWGAGATFEDKIGYSSRFFGPWLDRTEYPWQRLMDGWESEDGGTREEMPLYGREHVIRSTEETWKYHPGSFIAECWVCAGTVAEHYENTLHENFHGPNYTKVTMCASSAFSNGYDDLLMLSVFPGQLAFVNSYNMVFRVCQGDSRLYGPRNIFAGNTTMDWITKQMWDYFRPHALALQEGEIPVQTGMTWLGEPDFTLPEEMRWGLYAACLDPCRGAVCYPLLSTGRDGLLFWTWPRHHWFIVGPSSGEAAAEQYDWRNNFFIHREFKPVTTMRMHNAIISADMSSYTTGASFAWDCRNLGEFDSNSDKVNLISGFKTKTKTSANSITTDYVFDKSNALKIRQGVNLKPGSYDMRVECDSSLPGRMELFLSGQFIGSLTYGSKAVNGVFGCYVQDDKEQRLEIRRAYGEAIPQFKVSFEPTFLSSDVLYKLGAEDDSSEEFVSELSRDNDGQSAKRIVVDLAKEDSYSLMTAGVSGSRNSLPQVIDLYFDGERGNYMLAARAKSNRDCQRVDITFNSHRFAHENYENMKFKIPNRTRDWKNEVGIYARAGVFMLDKEWQSCQLGFSAPHRSGRRRFKLSLAVQSDGGEVEFDYIKLIKLPVENKILTEGGHESTLEQCYTLFNGRTEIPQTMRWRMIADEPTAFFEKKADYKTEAPLVTEICFEGYENINIDSSTEVKKSEGESKANWIEFSDCQQIKPGLKVVFFEPTKIDRVIREKNTIYLHHKSSAALKGCVTLRKGKTDDLIEYLSEGTRKVRFEDKKSITIDNQDGIEKVNLVNVLDRRKGPYFVKESGWWSVRGAQPLCSNRAKWLSYLDDYDKWILDPKPETMPSLPHESDLVRVFTGPYEQSQIQKWGYINNVVRPGWGSQKQMLVKDVQGNGCTVKVLSVSAYIFAPRVEFANKFTRAELNGKLWAYHDGQNLFLPQRPGTYVVKTYNNGQSVPTVTSTSACVDSAIYENYELKVKISKPDYVFKLPESMTYNVGLSYDSTMFSVKDVEGGKLIKEGPYGGIIDTFEDSISIHFARNK